MLFFTDKYGFTYCRKHEDVYHKYRTTPQHATLCQKSIEAVSEVMLPPNPKACTVVQIKKDENNEYVNTTDDVTVVPRRAREVWSHHSNIQAYVLHASSGNIFVPISMVRTKNAFVMDAACMKKVFIEHEDGIPCSSLEYTMRYSMDGPLEVKTLRLKMGDRIWTGVDTDEQYICSLFPSRSDVIERKFVKRMHVIS